ncbi:MAG: hypothetical protein B0D94_00280, partial [Candidatus Sedimenticola endophacoides]
MKSNRGMAAIAISIGLITTTGLALCDGAGERRGDSWFGGAAPGIERADTELYVRECGGCHFPYQPGLLPAESWERIMRGLDEHFGENAELGDPDRKTLTNYLLDNAAGRVNRGLPNKIMSAQRGRAMPLRITEMRYFVYEHSEIPRRAAQDNPDVKSLSNCDSCHRRAHQGLYQECRYLVKDFGTSQSPKSTRQRDSRYCPDRPALITTPSRT